MSFFLSAVNVSECGAQKKFFTSGFLGEAERGAGLGEELRVAQDAARQTAVDLADMRSPCPASTAMTWTGYLTVKIGQLFYKKWPPIEIYPPAFENS